MSVANSTLTPGGCLTGPMLLVEEINHRVLNEYAVAISSIHLALAELEPYGAAVRTVLTATAARLRAHAEVHRALQAPQTPEVNLDEHLSSVCAAITAAVLAERGVRLTLRTFPVPLDADRCWRVALIVSELITNAVRHGLRRPGGMIVVELGVRRGAVECVVVDNGLPVATPRASRGSNVLKALAAELGGCIAWDFTPSGTRARLTFPLAEKVVVSHVAPRDPG